MSKETILIVEDEAVTAMGLKKSLSDLGYSVIGIVPTGEQAVEIATGKKPDLIIMDIQLAGKMNGITAAASIRDKTRIPVIYLTAYSDDQFIEKAKITEPYGYLLKPVREQELRTTCEMALYKHGMEQKLRLSEETSRVLLNETNDIHFLINVEGIILLANKALAKKTGKNPEQLIGSPVHDLVAARVLSPKMVPWNMARLQTKSVHFEEEFKDNWFDISVHPICNSLGIVVIYAVHIHDITLKKKMEEQLLQNEEFFRTLIEDSADIIVILNRDGTIRHESPSLNKVVGYDDEIIAGKKLVDLIQKDDNAEVIPTFVSILEKPYMVKSIRIVFKNKDGKKVNIRGIISNLSSNPVFEGIVLCGWIAPP